MRCPKCGSTIVDNSKFCSHCGNIIEKSKNTKVKYICQDCNRSFIVDHDADVSMCPFCGSKELKNKDITERKPNEYNAKEVHNFRKSIFSKVILVVIFISFAFMIESFVSGSYISGVFGIIQFACVLCAWLMGMQWVKEIKPNLHILLFVVSLMLFIPMALTEESYSSYENRKYEWPHTQISRLVPTPDSKFGYVYNNDESSLRVDLYKTSQSDYTKYLSECKSRGFTLYPTNSDRGYIAYNEDLYKLVLEYFDYSDEITIELSAPLVAEEIVWPSTTLISQIPAPVSLSGKIVQEENSLFEVYIKVENKKEYDTYVNACLEMGFNKDYRKDSERFEAENKQGYRLTISYEKTDYMLISLREPYNY